MPLVRVPVKVNFDITCEVGLCYRFYHFRFYQFGPDNSAIRPISFVPISYQRGSQWEEGHPRRVRGQDAPATLIEGDGRVEGSWGRRARATVCACRMLQGLPRLTRGVFMEKTFSL